MLNNDIALDWRGHWAIEVKARRVVTLVTEQVIIIIIRFFLYLLFNILISIGIFEFIIAACFFVLFSYLLQRDGVDCALLVWRWAWGRLVRFFKLLCFFTFSVEYRKIIPQLLLVQDSELLSLISVLFDLI